MGKCMEIGHPWAGSLPLLQFSSARWHIGRVRDEPLEFEVLQAQMMNGYTPVWETIGKP